MSLLPGRCRRSHWCHCGLEPQSSVVIAGLTRNPLLFARYTPRSRQAASGGGSHWRGSLARTSLDFAASGRCRRTHFSLAAQPIRSNSFGKSVHESGQTSGPSRPDAAKSSHPRDRPRRIPPASRSDVFSRVRWIAGRARHDRASSSSPRRRGPRAPSPSVIAASSRDPRGERGCARGRNDSVMERKPWIPAFAGMT